MVAKVAGAPLNDAVADPVAFAGVTRLVRHRALAQVGTDSVQLHRLVRAILRDNPTRSTPSTEEMTTLARRLLRDVVPVESWDSPASWPVWRELLLHVLAVTDPTGTVASTDARLRQAVLMRRCHSRSRVPRSSLAGAGVAGGGGRRISRRLVGSIPHLLQPIAGRRAAPQVT